MVAPRYRVYTPAYLSLIQGTLESKTGEFARQKVWPAGGEQNLSYVDSLYAVKHVLIVFVELIWVKYLSLRRRAFRPSSPVKPRSRGITTK